MKLYKEGDLGWLNMADRLTYVRSLASKYNLDEFIQNSFNIKEYVYYIKKPVCNSPILHWCEENDHVIMATELKINMVDTVVAKDRQLKLYAYKFKPEYSIRNIERRLANYTKQAKEFVVKMKKEDIENDFKRT